MIFNEFHDGQGLGNQLWNYALARILAKDKACGFSMLRQERFKGYQFMDIDFGTISSEAPQHHYKEKTEYLSGTDIDISRTDHGLFDILPFTQFEGNCQSTKYLEGHRDDLVSWIKIKDEYKDHVTDENTCIIHLRTGDFKKIKDVFLPRKYYRDAMDHIRSLNKDIMFCCVTDEKEEAEKILPGVEIIGSAALGKEDGRKASHHRGGPVGIDFALLMNAAYLIIPNSSFSWWAAYLNTQKKAVIAPKYWARHNISNGYWSTSDIITTGFTYLDTAGKSFSSDECWEEKDAFEAEHPDMFSLTPRGKNRITTLIKKTLRDMYPKTSVTTLQEYRRGAKVYDIFTFFNELELLEIRLNILDEHVDYFVIVESTETFSGKTKELYYEKNKALFEKWNHKIIHHVIDDTPKDRVDLERRILEGGLSNLDKEVIRNTLTSDNVPEGQTHWLKEFYQKESIKKALINLLDDDLCFVSDVDEIWNPEIDLKNMESVIFRFKQRMYVYYLNNRSSEAWAGTLLTSYSNIRNACLNHVRTPRKTKYRYIKNGGWHFTNMGGADRIRRKLESYGHQEFNNDKIKADLEEKMASNTDFIGRRFRFWKDETGLPEYITSNRDKYKNLFK